MAATASRAAEALTGGLPPGAAGPGWCCCRWSGGCRPSAQRPRTDSQFGVAGCRIQLPTEPPLRQKRCPPITAPLLSAMAMWRWAPSAERVPERLRISRSPRMVVAAAAPAKRSSATERLPIPLITQPACSSCSPIPRHHPRRSSPPGSVPPRPAGLLTR